MKPIPLQPTNLAAILAQAQGLQRIPRLPVKGDFVLSRRRPMTDAHQSREIYDNSPDVGVRGLDHHGIWCVAECNDSDNARIVRVSRWWSTFDSGWMTEFETHKESWFGVGSISAILTEDEATTAINILTSFDNQEAIINSMARARASVVNALIDGDAQRAQNITNENNKLMERIKDHGLSFAAMLKMLEQ